MRKVAVSRMRERYAQTVLTFIGNNLRIFARWGKFGVDAASQVRPCCHIQGYYKRNRHSQCRFETKLLMKNKEFLETSCSIRRQTTLKVDVCHTVL